MAKVLDFDENIIHRLFSSVLKINLIGLDGKLIQLISNKTQLTKNT